MSLSTLSSQSKDDSNIDVNHLLEELDVYILLLVQKMVPHHISAPETLDLEIDELAQNVRIKFWLALGKGHVISHKAYLRSIVHNEVVDMVRRCNRVIRISIDDEGELCQGNVVAHSEGEPDPLHQIEQEEFIAEYITQMVNAVVLLPSRQRDAMICSLNDRLECVIQFVDAFKQHQIDIETIHWPEDERAKQSYRSSLCIARKKLSALLS